MYRISFHTSARRLDLCYGDLSNNETTDLNIGILDE